MARQHPGDERPISSPVARTIESAGHVVKHAIRGVGRRRAMAVAGIGFVVVFVGLLARSVSIAPDAAGVLTAVFASAFAALLFGAFAAWTLMWAFSDAAPNTIDRARVADIENAMETTVEEARQVRAGVTEVVRRGIGRVPPGALAGALLWTLLQWTDDPPSLLALVAFIVIGAALSAARRPSS